MRKDIAAILLLPSLLAGCNDPVSSGTELVALRGTCQTTFAPPPFPVPATFPQTDTGSCALEGLGSVGFSSVKEIDTRTGTQTTSELVLTFPDGDVLRGTGSGQNVPGAQGTIDFDATLSLNGGTGRYEGATGEARAEGSASMMQRTASFTLIGEARIARR